MSKIKVNETAAKTLPVPASGSTITYDTDLRGFGLRVTAANARAFILSYSVGGKERRMTIGQYPAWSAAAAREQAKELRRQIDIGIDPLAKRDAERNAETVSDLFDRYIGSELTKKRPTTQAEYQRQLKILKKHKIAKIKLDKLSFSDVDALHGEISKRAPIQANRVIAMLSHVFNLGVKWKVLSHNPAKGIERNHESSRERFLDQEEIARLFAALDAYSDQGTANCVRLLAYTGARRGETMSARWSDFDLKAGTWTKPAGSTKQKKLHRVPLSPQAHAMLKAMRKADPKGEFLFASSGKTGHIVDIKRCWATVTKEAKIQGCRLHDLRHSFASLLAGSGKSLPLIGKLLGHSNPATTNRYAHLIDAELRNAVNEVSSAFDAKPKNEDETAEAVG